jgi:very-short-patch-repair endonuclease
VRPRVHAYLATICRDLGAELVHVGGVADPVHIVTTLPRTLSQANLVEQIKKTFSKSVPSTPPPLLGSGGRMEVRGIRKPFSEEALTGLDLIVVGRARLLRKKATQPERILWRHLRNRNFAGYKFRRQHPFDGYVLDFYCPSAKLAIELDGGGHNYSAGRTRDQTRSEFLARHGVFVLRFWNHQVRQELNSVLRAIWFALEERQKNNPSPSSSPFGKGRGEVHVPSVE